MDRTASIVLLIKTFSFIVVILFLCTVNIFVFVRHKRNFLTISLHVFSLFLLSGLFCLMIDGVILNLPIEKVYQKVAYLSLIICGIIIAEDIVAIMIKRKKDVIYFGLSPNLEAVFLATNDLSLVADYRGIITQVNHPEKLDVLCRRHTTLMDVFSELKDRINVEWPFPEYISELTESIQCEVSFCERTEYYLLKVSPIILGEASAGFTVLFEDISAIRRSEINLSDQNILLKQANEKLSHFVKIAGALEAQKERLNILEQIQAALTEKIERAILCVRNIQNTNFENQCYQRDIREVANLLRGVYAEVRISVSRIAGKDA